MATAKAAVRERGGGGGERQLVGRFKLPSAPAGLRLAQDLVNTALVEQVGNAALDYLADLDTANAWLGQALGQWSNATRLPAPKVVFAADDLPAVRDLRESVRSTLRATSDNLESAAEVVVGAGWGAAGRIELTTDADGRVVYQPTGSGWQALAALISLEALLAQAAGTWSRLKTCAHPICGACFYDASPNRSRVWHDTKTCGNVNNLRASRTRRKVEKP